MDKLDHFSGIKHTLLGFINLVLMFSKNIGTLNPIVREICNHFREYKINNTIAVLIYV